MHFQTRLQLKESESKEELEHKNAARHLQPDSPEIVDLLQ
jgi:hypothetical protein